MNEEHVPVLIVGGSLVGLSTSALLASQGVQNMVVERHRGTAIHPRAASFHQRTMEIYRSVGLQQEVEAAAAKEFVQNGAIISVELPDVGDQIEAGEIFAEIESASTIHEVVAPVSGRVLAVNPQLEEQPSIINEDPYSEGWLLEVRLKNDAELDGLMGMDEYYRFVFKDNS